MEIRPVEHKHEWDAILTLREVVKGLTREKKELQDAYRELADKYMVLHEKERVLESENGILKRSQFDHFTKQTMMRAQFDQESDG